MKKKGFILIELIIALFIAGIFLTSFLKIYFAISNKKYQNTSYQEGYEYLYKNKRNITQVFENRHENITEILYKDIKIIFINKNPNAYSIYYKNIYLLSCDDNFFSNYSGENQ